MECKCQDASNFGPCRFDNKINFRNLEMGFLFSYNNIGGILTDLSKIDTPSRTFKVDFCPLFLYFGPIGLSVPFIRNC